MFERFTDRARRVVVFAQEQARELKHPCIEPEHLLLALIEEGEGIAALALEATVRNMAALEQDALTSLKSLPLVDDPPSHIPFTPASKKVLELSLREALQLGHNYIGTEHLLLAIIRYSGYDSSGSAAGLIERQGVTLPDVRKEVIRLVTENAPKPPPGKTEQEISEVLAEAMEQIATANKQLMLAAHTISSLADKLR